MTIATGYLAELIEAFFGDGSRHGVPIDYFREDEPLGTVGALSLIDGLDEDFLVMNGDILTDLDYRALLDRHREGGQAATIASRSREVQVSLGVMLFDTQDDPTRVTGYVEKPSYSYEVSMGVYCFAPHVRDYIPRGQRIDFPDLILRLVDADEMVRAWHSQDQWFDIGRHDDYEAAQDAFEQLRPRLIPDA